MNQKDTAAYNDPDYTTPVMVVDPSESVRSLLSNDPTEDELLLHSINKNISEGIYRSVHKMGLVYVNDAFVKMFGYENEFEVLSLDDKNLYSNVKEFDELSNEVIKKGSVANREIAFVKKDGTKFIGSFSSTMIVGRDGIKYFDGAIRDITLTKQAERKLKYQADIHNALVKISSKYINNSLENIEETVNSTLKELGQFLNVDRVQIHNYKYDSKKCSCSYEWLRKGINSTIKNSSSISISTIKPMVKLHSKGETLYINDVSAMEDSTAKKILLSYDIKSVISVPMMLENACVGFVSLDNTIEKRDYDEYEISMLKLFANMFVNITTRAFDQIKLHELLETTVAQNRRLKDFSHITSHNIRTSVANLIAIDDLLQNDSSNKQLLDSLHITVQKLNKSIYNINTLLNFDAKSQLLETKRCNIRTVFNRVLKRLDQTIQQNEIEIINDLPKKLEIQTLPVYLESVVNNLFSNAVRHGTNDTSKKIIISVEKLKNRIAISISDYGQGIDLERYGKKLFKAGVRFQINNCDGQGMGLFMAKYMTEAMGGSISVKSQINKGATFILNLPKALV